MSLPSRARNEGVPLQNAERRGGTARRRLARGPAGYRPDLERRARSQNAGQRSGIFQQIPGSKVVIAYGGSEVIHKTPSM
jgi:hypothetical protein